MKAKTRQKSGQRFLWDDDFLHMHTLTGSIRRNASAVSGIVLDIGCGYKPYQTWFENVDAYFGLDIDTFDSLPDLLASAMSLPFQSGYFDTVVSFQTFEHLREPWIAWCEIARVLKPGGIAIVSTHQSWRLHEEPFDFFRYTKYGLAFLAERAGLNVIAIEAHGGVWSLAGQSILTTFARFVPKNLRFITWPFIVIWNLGFMILDGIWPDKRDTMNYLILVQK